jgi:tight adherence protein C
MTYLIAAAVALSVGLMVVAVASLLPAQARPSRARLVELGLEDSFSSDASSRRSRAGKTVKETLAYLGKKIETPSRSWSPTQERLIQAGFRSPLALPIFLGGRLAASGALFFYFFFVGMAFGASTRGATVLGLLGIAFGWIVPNFLLAVRVSNRQKGIQKLLPDAVDLLVICVEAGLGLNQALLRVADELRHIGDNALTTEIGQMNLEIRAGTPRDQALMGLSDRTGVADVRSLVTMLIQTERFGTSVAESLRIHADTMRVSRQQRAEEAAAKTAIKLVFPLALCILPALLVVILGPAAIQVMEALQGATGG